MLDLLPECPVGIGSRLLRRRDRQPLAHRLWGHGGRVGLHSDARHVSSHESALAIRVSGMPISGMPVLNAHEAPQVLVCNLDL
jgi:hypothetical protein